MKVTTYLINTKEYVKLINPNNIDYILGDTFSTSKVSNINTLLLNLGTTNWDYKKYLSSVFYNLSSYITLSSYGNNNNKSTNLLIVLPLLKIYFLTAITFQTLSHDFKINVNRNCEEYKYFSELLLSLETITNSVESDDLWSDVKHYKKFLTEPHMNKYLKYTNVYAYEDILTWIAHRLVYIYNFDLDSLFKAYIEAINEVNTDVNLDLIKVINEKTVYLFDVKKVKNNNLFLKK